MKSEENLKELLDYIAVLKDYYKIVLSEENTDYNKAFIKGKLDVLEDIGKRFKKMNKAK